MPNKHIYYQSRRLPTELIGMILVNTTYKEAFMFGRYLTAKQKRKFATKDNLIHAYKHGLTPYLRILMGGIVINDDILLSISKLHSIIPIESFELFKYWFKPKHWIHILRNRKQSKKLISEFILDKQIKKDRYIWLLLIAYQTISEKLIKKYLRVFDGPMVCEIIKYQNLSKEFRLELLDKYNIRIVQDSWNPLFNG